MLAAIPSGLARPLAWLGMTSYSIYLLHPVAYQLAVTIGRRLPIVEDHRGAWATALTAVLATAAYRVIEGPMIRRGRRVAERAEARMVEAFPNAVRAPSTQSG